MNVQALIRELMDLREGVIHESHNEEEVIERIQEIGKMHSLGMIDDPDYKEFIAPVVETVTDGEKYHTISGSIGDANVYYYRKYPIPFEVLLINPRGRPIEPNIWPGRWRMTTPAFFRIVSKASRHEYNIMVTLGKGDPGVGYTTFIPTEDPMRTIDVNRAVIESEAYKIIRKRWMKSRSGKKAMKG